MGLLEIMRGHYWGTLEHYWGRDTCLSCVLWFCIWPTNTTCSVMIMNPHLFYTCHPVCSTKRVVWLFQVKVDVDGVLSCQRPSVVWLRYWQQVNYVERSRFTLPIAPVCVFSLFDFPFWQKCFEPSKQKIWMCLSVYCRCLCWTHK